MGHDEVTGPTPGQLNTVAFTRALTKHIRSAIKAAVADAQTAGLWIGDASAPDGAEPMTSSSNSRETGQ